MEPKLDPKKLLRLQPKGVIWQPCCMLHISRYALDIIKWRRQRLSDSFASGKKLTNDIGCWINVNYVTN